MKSLGYFAAFAGLCAVWMNGAELFGIGLALVFVVLGSVCLVLGAVGHDTLRLTADSTLARLREGLRDPRDTLTHILMLTEHSRRNGLVGLAEVETNWPPLHRVCSLVASAADEQRIRVEAMANLQATRLRSGLLVSHWYCLALALVVTGAFGTVLLALDVTATRMHVLAPLAWSLAIVAFVVAPVLIRLSLARERELCCIHLAYEGALKILSNNNVEAVFHALAELVPGAPSTVVASDLGELETGRGPWL